MDSSGSGPKTPQEAQARADRLRAFEEELRDLQRQKVLVLSPAQKKRVEQHIRRTLAGYTQTFDVDPSGEAKRLSWGMRIATFLGGLAICAGLYFLFLRIWGHLGVSAQIGSLAGLTLVLSAGVHYSAAREKTLYYASLLGLAAFSAFVMNVAITGNIFNIKPSPNAFLVWTAFALIVAYSYRLRLLLLAGLLCLLGYLSMKAGTVCGLYWLDFGEKPENFLIAGALITAIPSFFPHRSIPDFPAYYRGVGLLSAFTSILVLADWGNTSYFDLDNDTIERGYQVLGFVSTAGAIALGIRKNLRGPVNIGATYFTIFLYTKFYDWWWEWMPRYLFFLVIGAISVGVLYSLRRIRTLSLGRVS